MYSIEYQSDYILIISSYNDEFKIIGLDDVNPKIISIDTYFMGLDNNQIEEAIKKVLYNNCYDIEYELEQYRTSKLYHDIKQYNQE